METLHQRGQSQLNKGRKECQLLHPCYSKGSVLHESYRRTNCDTLIKQTPPGWAIADELQEHELTGMLNSKKRAFPTFTEKQGLKYCSPRNGWKDFLRGREQWDPEIVSGGYLAASRSLPGTRSVTCITATPDCVVTTQGCRAPVFASSQTNPELSPQPAPEYAFYWHCNTSPFTGPKETAALLRSS